MKIGIDASRAFSHNRTGIEEYSYQIIRHLVEPRHCLGSTEIILYIRKKQKVDFDLPVSWKIKKIKFLFLWTQIGLSLEMLFHPVDVLFIPAHVVPVIHPKNTVVTIHGLEFEIYPAGYSFWARLYMRLAIRLSCRWAKKIIAVSNNTKNDLMKLYKVPERKITVIFEGCGAAKYQLSIINYQSISNDQISKFKPYLLFIGRLEKRKNVEGIIDAYKILIEKYKISHSLVLAGGQGYGFDIIKLKIENCKLKIIQLGYVDEATKWQLLSNADVFLFPTFYEGFGLPILEAQNAGVPVVCSNNSSLPEAVGESAVFCDPKSPASIAEAVYKLISDSDLRNDIIKKGYENVKRFSWQNCSFEISKILKNINE